MIAQDPPRGRDRGWPVLPGLLLLLLLAVGEGRAAWYAKFDGISGDLTEGPFAGWTLIQSAGALVCLPVDPTNGTAGTASFSCAVRKSFDRTSPALLQKCGLGESVRRVTLAYVLSQPEATQYRITLDNAFVSSVAQVRSTNSPLALDQEEIRLTFDKIEVACFDLDAHGGTAGGLTGLYDQTTAQGGLKTRLPLRATITRQSRGPGIQVTWPAELGHRYEIQSRAAVDGSWTRLVEATASADGPLSQVLPPGGPSLLLRVVELD